MAEAVLARNPASDQRSTNSLDRIEFRFRVRARQSLGHDQPLVHVGAI